MKKIKLLYIVESFATGVYSVIKDVASNLDQDEFEITIAHSLRKDSPDNYAKDFNQANIKLVNIPMDGFLAINAVSSIKTLIRETKPDIVHAHSSIAGLVGRIAAKMCRHKCVFYSPHGFAFLRQDVGKFKSCLFFTAEKCISILAGGTIIAVSAGELEYALKVSKKAIAVNNFIDADSVSVSAESAEPVIATVGRIMPQKNPKLFNDIANSMPQQKFLWIGDGEQRNILKAENIAVTGYLPREKVFDILAKSQVYLQTSLWEGMPVSILEAMAAAKPVVASDIVGNRDLIDNGKTGYLCSSKNKQEFIARINELLKDEKLRNRLGTNARQYVVKNHSLMAAIEQYSRIYRLGCLRD